MDIRFEKDPEIKEKPDQKNLGFGKYMTDYMFVMDWTKEDGWKDARIVPGGPYHNGSGMCDTSLCTGNIRRYEKHTVQQKAKSSCSVRRWTQREWSIQTQDFMPEFPVDMFVEAVEALCKSGSWLGSIWTKYFSLYQTIYVCNRSKDSAYIWQTHTSLWLSVVR